MLSSPQMTFYILLFTFLLYLMQDGRALALCVVAPFCSESQKIKIFTHLIPSWDANQTWLVFTIAGLYGAFPAYFASIFSDHYLMIIVALIGFIGRGASLEFYAKSLYGSRFFLILLSICSLKIIMIHGYFLSLLLPEQLFNTSTLLPLLLFLIVYYAINAFCYLFELQFSQRVLILITLIFLSSWLLSAFHIHVSHELWQLSVFILRIILLSVFLITLLFRVTPAWYARGLLYILFLTNGLFIARKVELMGFLTFASFETVDVSSPFWVTNIFSLVMIPLIIVGLTISGRLFRY